MEVNKGVPRSPVDGVTLPFVFLSVSDYPDYYTSAAPKSTMTS